MVAVTDRLAGSEADLLNVPADFPLFQRLALPIQCGRSKIPGIKIQDTRILRLMEVLLHGGSQLAGWRTAQIHESIRAALGLSAEAYTLTQLRYDIRKMKGHGLVEQWQTVLLPPHGQGQACRRPVRPFQQRICGPPGQLAVSTSA